MFKKLIAIYVLLAGMVSLSANNTFNSYSNNSHSKVPLYLAQADGAQKPSVQSTVKDKAQTALKKIKFVGGYNESGIKIVFDISQTVQIGLGYNLGFDGAGDIEFGFPPEVNPALDLKFGSLVLNNISLSEMISQIKSKGLPAELTNIISELAPLKGKWILFVKLFSLLSTVANNKRIKSTASPQPKDIVVELNKLLIRWLKTPGVENVNAILAELPGPLKETLNQVDMPNLIDKDLGGDTIKLVAFLDRRISDIRNVIAKKFEFDPGYVAEVLPERLTPYQTVQSLFAILYRAQLDANKGLVHLLTKIADVKQKEAIANSISEKYGADKRKKMGEALSAYAKGKKAYSDATAAKAGVANAFKEWQKAKYALLGFVIQYVEFPRVGDKVETIQQFVIRELKKLIPHAPGFDKVAPVLDSILQPLGLSLNNLIGNEKLPEPPAPAAGEDPAAEIAVDADIEF